MAIISPTLFKTISDHLLDESNDVRNQISKTCITYQSQQRDQLISAMVQTLLENYKEKEAQCVFIIKTFEMMLNTSTFSEMSAKTVLECLFDIFSTYSDLSHSLSKAGIDLTISLTRFYPSLSFSLLNQKLVTVQNQVLLLLCDKMITLKSSIFPTYAESILTFLLQNFNKTRLIAERQLILSIIQNFTSALGIEQCRLYSEKLSLFIPGFLENWFDDISSNEFKNKIYQACTFLIKFASSDAAASWLDKYLPELLKAAELRLIDISAVTTLGAFFNVGYNGSQSICFSFTSFNFSSLLVLFFKSLIFIISKSLK